MRGFFFAFRAHRGEGGPARSGVPMKTILVSWQFWALASAAFAALTAIFAKVGVAGVGSDFATLIRTAVILGVVTVLVLASGQWQPLSSVSGRTWVFLVLSGMATGASWLCYFRALKIGDAARVAPIDKLSVVFVAVIATVFLGEKLSGTNWLGVALIAAGAVLVAVKV
jgi:transporter family protein